MKISREWLQTYFEKPLPNAKELVHALTFHAFEVEGIEPHGDDDILDIKVTPNRGHDALSHRGIAKEISAILSIPFVDPLAKYGHGVSIFETKTNAVSVSIEDPNLCRRFTAAYIRGVKVAPSPDWLRRRLEVIGQRSINNVVDATNYVMFGIGQPLHAFDASKLVRGRTSDTDVEPRYGIEVRNAKKGEKMMALDEKEYALTDSMLVVADANNDEAIGIAGVKGGMPAGINESTRDIILEAANFNGVSIRRTSQALKLRTDASSRFEQVLSPEYAAYGMRAVVDLILEQTGGELAGFVDEYPNPDVLRSVSVTVAHVNKLLGTSLSEGDVLDALTRLGLPANHQGDALMVEIPFERLDIVIPEDLIEEVGRIVGYEKVVAAELSPFPNQPEVNQLFAASERVREDFIAKGYSEVYTSVFAEKGERQVLNKVGGGKSYLRANLTDGLAEALEKNIHNKDLLGLKEVRLFEIGSVWPKVGAEEIVVGVVGEKEKAYEQPLSKYIKDVSSYDALPVSTLERYQPFSRYPSITRDIALWVPSGINPEDIESMIRSHAGDLLMRVDLFDQFEKAGRTSYAFRLVFQSFDKTLTDDDANHRMESVYKALKSEGYEIR